MNMELLSRITIGVILTANLSACEVVDILTFKAHPNSGVSTSTTTVELLSKQPLPKGQTRDQTADDDYGLCQSQSGPNIAPLLLPVISRIPTLFADSGTQAISAWADKKKKEFTTTLSVNANQEALLLKHPDGLHLAFDCVVVRQSSDKHVSRSATVQQPYLVFAGRLIVSNDKTAFRIVPTYLEFAKATAKT